MVPIKKNLLDPSKYNLKCPVEATAAGMEFIVVHNTGNSAPASNEVAYMIRNGNPDAFNAAVDDKEIVIGIPFDKGAFAAGQRYANAHGIHIEICYSLKDSDLERFKKAERNAAEYIAQLLEERGWGIAQVRK
ncbi:MAG: N-acetylmuramoyl-L-alanine amidase family protein, partial [Acutalibacteraceae bacterium]